MLEVDRSRLRFDGGVLGTDRNGQNGAFFEPGGSIDVDDTNDALEALGLWDIWAKLEPTLFVEPWWCDDFCVAQHCVAAHRLGLSLSACEEEEPPARPPKPTDTAPPPPENSSPWHCNDGEDNDMDGWVDCDDPDCESSEFCTEWVEDGDCSDGIDNDGDGLVDCDDSDCVEADDCEIPSNEDPECR